MAVGWFSLDLENEWIITNEKVRPIIEAFYQQDDINNGNFTLF